MAAAMTFSQVLLADAARPATTNGAARQSAIVRPLQVEENDIWGYRLEDPDEAGWFSRRLEIGWRVALPKADTKSRWHDVENYGFLGSMERFDEADDYYFSNFVISYKLSDWFAIGATWDEIAEVAHTRSADHHKDGEWTEQGPSISAILTTPRLYDFVSPYVEIGAHFPHASFDAYHWWAFGYPSPAEYAALGSPSRSNKGYRRVIDTKASDPVTLLWGAGIKFYVTENLALDLAYRHIDCDIDAHYHLNHKQRMFQDCGRYKIPLSYSQLCFGVRWAF